MLPPLRNAIFIASGAAAGGLLRHVCTAAAMSPTSALIRVCAVNVTGSFILGTVNALKRTGRVHADVVAGLGVGFCGGFTTFSTFAAGALGRAKEGERRIAVGYVVLSCLLGVWGVAGGEALGGWLFRRKV